MCFRRGRWGRGKEAVSRAFKGEGALTPKFSVFLSIVGMRGGRHWAVACCWGHSIHHDTMGGATSGECEKQGQGFVHLSALCESLGQDGFQARLDG